MHFVRNFSHLRLIIAVVLGAITTLFLPAHLRSVTMIRIGCNTSIWIYLIPITWLMLHADQARRDGPAKLNKAITEQVYSTLS